MVGFSTWDANTDAEGNPTDEALEVFVYPAQGEIGLIDDVRSSVG